ncbi:MAG: galactitol-1-phosphate 5-dehydrogenase [Eubacteriales bacterium]|nr:galactitol-1-phosphate 5-dehydrogenase [Eubacteriales bacterium]
MKALVVTENSKAEIRDVPVPEIGADDVLVRVKACAICGSDVHGYDGSSGRRRPPVIMGHEAAGVIERTGGNVTDYAPGDRVTFDSTEYCGTCYYCRKGMVNLCENRRVLGVSCGEYNRDGAMAEYIAVPQRILYRLPDAVTFQQAAMVEPLSIAVHAVNMSPLRLGDKAVVVGCGTIGLLLIQTLKAAGCGAVVALDVDEGKLALARRLGATETVNTAREDAPECVRALTGGRGADLAFEAVGVSQTFNIALDCARKGGGVVLVGNVASRVDFNLQKAVTSQIALYTSCASAGEYDVCLSLIASGRVDVDSLVSACAPLAEGDGWLARLHAAEPGLIKVELLP